MHHNAQHSPWYGVTAAATVVRCGWQSSVGEYHLPPEAQLSLVPYAGSAPFGAFEIAALFAKPFDLG